MSNALLKYTAVSVLLLGLLVTANQAPAQNRNQQSGGQGPHPGPAPRYQHPPANYHAPVQHNPVPRQAPDQFHPAYHQQPVQEYHPATTRDVRIYGRQPYTDITNYHINTYHTTVNAAYAGHPGSDRGYWSGGWYHGYWHDYWQNQSWVNWGGHYGFWLSLDGLNYFVYEYSPGVCWYWNGFQWLPWYNPPYTAYQCPY